MNPFNKEKVYDEKINPLMAQIISICKENGMPMIASICFSSNGGIDDAAQCCTTLLPTKDGFQLEKFTQAARIIKHK